MRRCCETAPGQVRAYWEKTTKTFVPSPFPFPFPFPLVSSPLAKARCMEARKIGKHFLIGTKQVEAKKQHASFLFAMLDFIGLLMQLKVTKIGFRHISSVMTRQGVLPPFYFFCFFSCSFSFSFTGSMSTSLLLSNRGEETQAVYVEHGPLQGLAGSQGGDVGPLESVEVGCVVL